MVGKKVWVVEYNHPDFSDLNGVFSTEEKAKQSILNDSKRCHWWKNFTVDAIGDRGEWTVFKFICVTEKENLPVSVIMYKTEIR